MDSIWRRDIENNEIEEKPKERRIKKKRKGKKNGKNHLKKFKKTSLYGYNTSSDISEEKQVEGRFIDTNDVHYKPFDVIVHIKV